MGPAWQRRHQGPLYPYDSYSRMNWPGLEPIASWCFATTWWAASSCGAPIC